MMVNGQCRVLTRLPKCVELACVSADGGSEQRVSGVWGVGCGDGADEPLLRHALQRGEQELAALERDIRTAQESSVRDSAEWVERREAAAAAAAAGAAMAGGDDGDELSLTHPAATADDVHKWRSIERWAQVDSAQAAEEESGDSGGGGDGDEEDNSDGAV